MKHLKIRGELMAPDYRKVKVTVLQQTHFGEYFGDKTLNYNYRRCPGNSFVHNDIRLFSWIGAGKLHPDKAMGAKISICLSHSPPKRQLVFTLPIEYWASFKEAVIAYNEYFSDDDND